MTTLNQQKLELAQTEIGNVDYHLRASYVNLVGLRETVADHEREINKLLIEHSAPEVFRIQNSKSHVTGLMQSHVFAKFAHARLFLDVFEKNETAQKAFATIQPMLDNIAAIEADIQAENKAHAEALHALREAEDAARLSAELKLANDPTIKAARLAAEQAAPALVPPPVEHPAPYRGKSKIENGVAVPVEA